MRGFGNTLTFVIVCLVAMLVVPSVVVASSSSSSPPDPLQIAKKVIEDNPVVIFSKSYCPYCRRAKDLFNKYNIQFKAFELDLEGEGVQIQGALQSFTGQRTVPNIFINKEHIGGYDALSGLDARKELVHLLKEAGLQPKEL